MSRTTVDEVLAPFGPDTSSRAFPTRRANQPPWWLVLAAGITLVLVSIPLVYLMVRVSDLPFQGLLDILQRPRIAQLAGNTIGLSVAVTGVTLVFGTAIAALISRVRVGAPKTWLLLSALPLAVPSYLASYGWLVLSPGLNGFFPSFVLLTAVTIPYVILPVAAALRGTSADAESVARTLGLSPFRAFTSVTWPQVRPAAVAGALLVFLYTVSDFGLVAMLRFQTLTWGVQQAYAASFDRSHAAVLALLLVVIALVVVISERKVRGQVKPTAGTHLPVESVGAPLRIFSIGLIATPVVVGVVMPLVGLGMRLFQAQTLQALDYPRLAQATGNTVGVSVLAAVLALLLALPLAALAARYRSRLVGAMESLGYLSHALPGIVVGLSLVFLSLSLLPSLYQTLVVLVFAYAVLFMPKALGTARASIEGVSVGLVDVARTLGASPFQAWRRVTLPLALPGLGIGALLVAITTMKELPATLLLRPTGFDTLATELWSKTTAAEFGAAAPYAAILVLVAAIPAMILSGVRRVAKEEM